MANTSPAEIATTLTLAAMKSGTVDGTAEAVSAYYIAVYKQINGVLGFPSEVTYKWEDSPPEKS